jgi:hypothetical protein
MKRKALSLLTMLHILVCSLTLLLLFNSCIEDMSNKSSSIGTSASQDIKKYSPIEYSHTNEYSIFEAKENSPNFSFEYPVNYTIISYNHQPAEPVTFLSLSRFPIWEIATIESPGHPSINITTHTQYNGETRVKDIIISAISSPFVKDPFIEMIRVITGYESEGKNSKVTEKNRVTIDGKEGWESVSFVELLAPPFNIIEPVYHPMVCRDLFFEYKGSIWQIRSRSDIVKESEGKGDYEHVVKTFKILD